MAYRFRAKHLLGGILGLLAFFLLVVPLVRFGFSPLSHCGKSLEPQSIPDTVVAGVISQEDGRFFEHFGIDWFQIKDAAASALRRGRVGRGASTIDMQAAGLCYLDSAGRSSLYEKWQELVLATLMNVFYDKSEILRAYLSKVPMNPDKSVEGFPDASRYYYKSKLRNLENSQELKLVTTLRNRERFNPRVFDANMRGKHLRVLRRVEREQYYVKMALRKRIAGFDYVWVRKYPPPPPPPADPLEEATDEEMDELLSGEGEASSEPAVDAPTDSDPDPLQDSTDELPVEAPAEVPGESATEIAPGESSE